MASVGRMKLGSQGLEVSAQGLGCLGMSAFYGPPKPEADMITLIHRAVRSGITFLDTSDMYGPFTNEILLGKVIFFLSFFFFLSFSHPGFQFCYVFHLGSLTSSISFSSLTPFFISYLGSTSFSLFVSWN